MRTTRWGFFLFPQDVKDVGFEHSSVSLTALRKNMKHRNPFNQRVPSYRCVCVCASALFNYMSQKYEERILLTRIKHSLKMNEQTRPQNITVRHHSLSRDFSALSPDVLLYSLFQSASFFIIPFAFFQLVY